MDTNRRTLFAASLLTIANFFLVLALLAFSPKARAAGADPLGDIPLETPVYTAAQSDAAFGARTWYATSQTAQGTAAKVATTVTGDFALTNGACVLVKFSSANTAETPTLDVDGKGARTVRKYGTTSALAYEWQANEVVAFVYDGTQFQIIKGGWATTTYYGATKLSTATNSTSTALAATPSAVKDVRDEIGRVAAASVSASSLASATNALAAQIPSLLGSPYVHLGSTVVEEPDSAWSASFVGGGSYANGVLTVMPESQTKDTGVFMATITSTDWIVDLTGQAETTAYTPTQEPSSAPTSYHISRIDGYTYQITATNVTPSWTATKPYFMRIRNFKVLTYDRPAYTPNATTNDAAALPSFVDTVRIADADTPARIVANAQAVRNYVGEVRDSISKAAWTFTPAGKKGQTGAVVMDLPVVHRGSFSWLVAGNAAAISADGGDWVADASGSYYQIGLAGRADFRLTATDQQLQITDLQWSGTGANATVSLDIPVSQLADPSTPPQIRYIDSLEPPYDWIDCTEQVSSRVSSVWRCTVSGALADIRFFSAWASQGTDTAYIRGPLELGSGQIKVGNDTYSVQTVTIGGTTYKILASPQ